MLTDKIAARFYADVAIKLLECVPDAGDLKCPISKTLIMLRDGSLELDQSTMELIYDYLKGITVIKP